MKHDKLNINQLEAMIDRYFECDLTEAEERQLLHELAVTSHRSVAIDEARFTMGFLGVGMERHLKRKRSATLKRTWHVAAVAMVALVAGSGIYLLNARPSGECHAYVNGKLIDHDEQVMSMIKNDMSSLGEASTSIDNNMLEQLSIMGEAQD